jgi:hypothetical protein
VRSFLSKERRVLANYVEVDALTHLNFAFAYIDPKSFNVITMDPQTEASLFQDATDVKQFKSDLQVFVSIGGWTYVSCVSNRCCISAYHLQKAFPTTAQVLSRFLVTSRQLKAIVKGLPTMLSALWINMDLMVLTLTGESRDPECLIEY